MEKLIELEMLCESLSYGSEKSVEEIEKALKIFIELEKMINILIGGIDEKK